MRRIFFFCFLLTAAVTMGITSLASAGNKWMMEKNANELIMLNSMLLQRLGTIHKDGRIILEGDVVHEDGKMIIKLYKLRQIDAAGGENILTPETFDQDLPYQIFLREESLTEIPVLPQDTGRQHDKTP